MYLLSEDEGVNENGTDLTEKLEQIWTQKHEYFNIIYNILKLRQKC